MYVLYLVYDSASMGVKSICEIFRYKTLAEAKHDYAVLSEDSDDMYIILYEC